MRRDEILGWRRTVLVRIFERDGVLRDEAVGQRHRLLRTAPVPLGTAMRLIAGGVPWVADRRRGG